MKAPKAIRILLASAMLAMTSAGALAEFPERPLRIFLPTAAGGAADVILRTVTEKAQQFLGQPIIVDNRSGGVAGTIATQALLAAPPDGYQVVYQTTAMTIIPWMGKLAFDPADLVPVIRIGTSPYAMVVGANHPAKNLDEFISYAKERAGKVACSSTGVGSPPHMAIELLMRDAGVSIIHVPYRGFPLAYTDLGSGRIDCSLEPASSVLSYVKAGTVRAIGMTSKVPAAELPEAYPIALKYPSVDVQGWGGLFASAKAPKATVQKIHDAFAKALRDPDTARRLREMGVQFEADTSEAFGKLVEENKERYGAIVKSRNIRLE